MTVSLTKEEREAISKIVKRYKLKAHAVVKVALRYFLFPKERENIPIDGFASVKEINGEMKFNFVETTESECVVPIES